ncbi:MAG TPA: hypothetical protein VM935_17525, partial [Chitinophagaceae bacterium]|nr:hypothetical protein [Chitinophagaceae bacterium]
STDILDLREIIKETIAPTISLHRKSRGTLDTYGDSEVTAEEIDRLLFSIPHFERALVIIL